jgi:CubicO group peptidase (beta-lactamase class C family)
MMTLNSGVTLALFAVWLFASPNAIAQGGPTFLQGDWNVTSDYLLGDGSTERTTAVAAAAEETIVGTTTLIQHKLVGTREGQDVEAATTFALNPANAQWVMMQADSLAGTVDLASGALNTAGTEWLFTSFPATRPDGGLDRFHYTDIMPDSYTLTVSRSFDGGVVWEPFWIQAYTRAPSPVVTTPLPGATTCTQQEYGQFDFWLGEWNLVSSSGQSSGDRSSVKLATGDCVVEETYLPTSGGGVSRSMYDARSGEWARVWIEPGRMLIFVNGGLDNGDMIMTGGTTGIGQFTNRTVWQPRADNSVRQFTQTSADNGATWTNAGFDATYVPQGSPSPPPPPTNSGGGGGGGSIGWIEFLVASLLFFRRQRTFHIVALGLLLSGCGGGGTGEAPLQPFQYSYQAPVAHSDGWAVDTLAVQDVDINRLTSMMNLVHDRGHNNFLRSILIAKNDKLVFEEYFSDVGMNSLSHMQSATKSIVSAIFGLAVTEGFVASLDTSLFSYFPEYDHLGSEAKDAILIRHVLSMTPGFDWNENSSPTFGSENDNIAAYRSANYIEYVLQKDLVSAPGAAWNYNSGCPMMLAGIVKNQSGVHLDDFAAQRFFGAMGITNLRWEYQADGLPLATGGLWLRGRDSAKIGQVFLDGGRWQGQQVVPADWVESSLTEHVAVDSARGYGLLWWTQQRASSRIWYAAGYGGQLIILVPSRSAVIVTNANYTRDSIETGQRQAAIWGLLDNYILPAL